MAPELMAELEDEVLLRIPADEPATLVRASLACKRWRHLILDDSAFRRRRRELHRPPPPLLGFACNIGSVSDFVPTSSFCCPLCITRIWRALDARHGRVLLHGAPLQICHNRLDDALVVWDPVADERRELPKLPYYLRADNHSWNAALLCAPAVATSGAAGDRNSRRRPFTFVLVGTNGSLMFSYVFSSEANSWNERTYPQRPQCVLHLGPSLLVGNVFNPQLYIISYEGIEFYGIKFYKNVPSISAHEYIFVLLHFI